MATISLTPEQQATYDAGVKKYGYADPLKTVGSTATNIQAPTAPQQPAGTTTPTTPTAPTPSPYTGTPDQTKTLSTATTQLDLAQKEAQDAATNFSNTITKISNGSIPLSQGEQAQVNALQSQYQGFIDAQKQQNAGATGVANIRGYQTGAAEYDPTFQAKTIGAIFTAGQQKVAKLSTEMSGAVAKLTQSLRDNDIANIKTAYDAMTTARDKQQKALQDTIEKTQKAIEKAQEEHTAAVRDTTIAKLFDSGVTSSSAILQKLNAEGGNYTAKEVDDALKIINPGQDLAGLSADYRTYLALKKTDSSVKNMSWLQYQKAVTNATTKVSSSGIGGGGGQISPITQSVIANPSLFDDLTPTVRGQVIAELQASGYNTLNLGTKNLSDGAIQTIAQTQSAISNLNDLKQKITDNMGLLGPITGLAALNPFSESRKIQADINRVKQVVGKALEGGVLRKEDEEKYKQILATITDTPETAIYKIDSLISSIQRDMETYKSLQSSAGRSIDVNAPLIKNGTEVPVTDLRAKYGY